MAVNWQRNLYALFAAEMLAIVAFSLRAPFLPFYLSDLGAKTTDAQTLWSGIINAGGAGVMAITAPFWGTIADRYGRKPMLIRAMAAAVITIALMSLATEVWHLLALRLIEGSLTGTVTAATALVAAGTPKDRLGYGLGLIQTAVFSGASLGPLAGGYLGDQIGYRATFLIASAMMASAALVVLFFVHEQFTPQQRVTTTGRGGFGVWSLVSGRIILTMIIAMTVIRLASSSVQPIMPLFVEQLAHAASGTASTLSGITLGIAGVTSAISAVILGRLGDRAGYRRILLWSTFAAGILYFPMAAAQAPWQLIVLQALFGFAAGGLIPAANAIVANNTPPDRRGAVYGLMAAAQSAGGFVGPLAGSFIAASLGFPVALSVTGALLLGLTAGLAYSGRADRASSPNPATASRP